MTRRKTVQVFDHALPQAGLCGETALKQLARLRDNRLGWLRRRGDTQGLQAREHLCRFFGLASLQ
ncbi:MAG TPA: hypothetical protein VJ860_13185 [Polyangia bacterium]|nr:hypothetical protein [Polyangia bacterium]